MTGQLVPGMVVSFNGEGEYEVVSLLQNGRTVELQKDDGEPLTVRFDSAAFEQVVRKPGDQVRSTVNGMVGLVQGPGSSDDQLARDRVLFPGGRVRTVPETALRGVPIT